MNNLFFLHPTKCGGQSVAQCLDDMNITYYPTHALLLNQSTLDLLKSDQRVMVFGHIYKIPSPMTDEQALLKSEILKLLYFHSDMIMPTRNPSNLLQSWMHYSVLRSNQVLSKFAVDFDIEKCTGKDLSMLAMVSELRQDIVKVKCNHRGRINQIRCSANSSQISLKPEDEEHNLLKLFDFLLNFSNDGSFKLNSMSVQLYAPCLSKIKKAIRERKKFSVKPPASNNKRRVIYYDCEDIDSRRQYLLDDAVCPGFSARLLRTRMNASFKKSKNKGCDFESVNALLQKNIPSEWQIYAQSKEKI